MRIQSFAKRRDDANSCDDDFIALHSSVLPVNAVLGMLCVIQKRNQGEHGCSPFNTVSFRGWSALFGRDQFVDLGAEILQNEVFFSRRFAFVHFLRPLFKRNLDAEFFVDRKDDVEEIEAVDAQIINGVAFGRDGITIDFTCFSNDVGDFVKSRGQVSIPLFLAMPLQAYV